MKKNESTDLPFLNQPKKEEKKDFQIRLCSIGAKINEMKVIREALSPELAMIFFPEIMVLRNYEGKASGCCTLTENGKVWHGLFIIVDQIKARMN